MIRRLSAATLGTLLFLPVANAAEPEADPTELPRIPATEPAQAVATFEVEPGFELDLVAHEPLVTDPIAIAFDESGALFVVEMRSYSERREEALCRIRRLTDTDGDGIFDKATIYAEGLKWATAVGCWKGGIFVAATPDVFYFHDDDGDGVADSKTTVFTGFGTPDPSGLNVQGLVNSFQWGLDNRIYGSTAPNAGMVRKPSEPENAALSLRGADFSFNPATGELRRESGTAQYGLSFDSQGRRFLSSNSNHIIAVMYDTWRAGSGLLPMPAPLASIAVDGPSAEVFRISPDEPWRIVRTRWRSSGMVAGMVEGGGRVSGYFTAATGITIYTGDTFGPEFADNGFIGDAGSNLVHRKVIRQAENGVSLQAERAANGQGREFLRSKDNWFRPTTFSNAPDGCLYVVDMYRETIEHPKSLPEGIKKYLDLNSGNDRGRIYRVRPKGAALRPSPRLGGAPTPDLVATLAHPNGWHRLTAQRLLFERQDPAATAPLTTLLKDSPAPLARLHALHALDGQNGLTEELLTTALQDPDERVKAHAVRIGAVRGSNWTDAIAALSRDTSPTVRFEVAQALGQASGDHKDQALADLATLANGDPWLEGSVLNALRSGPEAGRLFEGLSQGHVSDGFMTKLVQAIGRSRDATAAAPVVERIAAAPDEADSQRLLRALGEGLASTGSGKLSEVDATRRLDKVFADALRDARESTTPGGRRLAALNLLRYSPAAEAGPVALAVLAEAAPPELQLAAIDVAQALKTPGLDAAVLPLWAHLSPRVRGEAVAVLAGRPETARALLEAVQKGSVSPAEIPSPLQISLLKHARPEVKALAESIYAKARASRQEVINRYLDSERLKGDAARGQAKFETICIACHRSGDKGFPVGPDRVTFKTKGRTIILTNVLDPNREVAPQYLAYALTTTGGETATGTIASENPSSVTLRLPFGEEKEYSRASIASLQALGQSLMPEGLEAQLTPQDLADLLEYITTAP